MSGSFTGRGVEGVEELKVLLLQRAQLCLQRLVLLHERLVLGLNRGLRLGLTTW